MIPPVDVAARNHVVVMGRGKGPVVVLSHGFGCDQNMWRRVAPALAEQSPVVLFDHVGAGRSDLSTWNEQRYRSLRGYADDVLEILRELDLPRVVFVGHSVSAMIGVLAAAQEPERFAGLVLLTPSPRYIDDGDYRGGFSATDIDELLESLESNYLGWSAAMAPVIMGNPERPELSQELTNSFCGTDPHIPGDTLLLYTDGLVEGRVDHGARYDEKALHGFLTELAPTTAVDAVAAVRALLDGFGDVLDDDTAVLALSVTGA